MDQKDSTAPFNALCLEVLKAIGKTLGQMNLYSASHPAVRAMMQDSIGMLGKILAQCPDATLTYSLDNEKVVANGRVVGQIGQLPSAIANLYARFHLQSITFKSGVSVEEMGSLCQLAALRPDVAKGVDAAKRLSEQGVTHIQFNEALYAKVGKEGALSGSGGGGADGPVGSAQLGDSPFAQLASRMREQSLEDSLESLIKFAVPDPKERAAIMGMVLKQIRGELEKKVAEATRELRQNKNVLENEQVRTQAVLGHAAGGVIVVDGEGKVLMMNPQAEELFGIKIADLAGKVLSENVKEQHMLTLASEIPAPSDRPIRHDVNVVGKGDSARTLRASTAVVQNEAGKPVGMLSALSDVAKHQELDKMEREFVAHVTHELRAPLTAIQAALEILDDLSTPRADDEEKRMIGTALRNVTRLDGLIRDILDFSKIESGQMTVLPSACLASDIAKEAVEGLKPWTAKKGLQLTLDVASSLPRVKADSRRSVQVLVNLLSNAIKFTPKGGGITVRAYPGSGEHARFVVYQVTDTGPGIPKADQDRVFEKFVQIAEGLRHVGGTGLGLAIAKAMIHLQKGKMWLESEPGHGATFSFTLPYYVASPEEARAVTPQRQVAVPWWKRLFGSK